MNRQEKIDAIYEKIADKTLSFGCIVAIKDTSFVVDEEDGDRDIPADIYFNYGSENNLYIRNVIFSDDYFYINEVEKAKYSEMYDFKYLNESEIKENQRYFFFDEKLENNKIIGHPVMIGDVLEELYGDLRFSDFAGIWKELRKPIEDQSDECLDFVYDLIFK